MHLTAYLAWALALAHGVGTDTGEAWARWVYVGSMVVVTGSFLVRPRRTESVGIEVAG